MPEEEIGIGAKHGYFSSLAKRSFSLEDYLYPRITKIKKERFTLPSGKPVGGAEIYVPFFDVTKNLFSFYIIEAVRKNKSLFRFTKPKIYEDSGEKKGIRITDFFQRIVERGLSHPSEVMFELLEQKFTPIKVSRAIIGPFLSQRTENPEFLQECLGDEDSSILCLQYDQTFSGYKTSQRAYDNKKDSTDGADNNLFPNIGELPNFLIRNYHPNGLSNPEFMHPEFSFVVYGDELKRKFKLDPILKAKILGDASLRI